jgi:DNA helicase II / ATP-dependent DNA helicase PcrA
VSRRTRSLTAMPAVPASASASFPGPIALGRGAVVDPGAPTPDGFAGAPRVRIDDDVLATPDHLAAFLHERWLRRERVLIELAVDTDALRQPEVTPLAPHQVPDDHTFARERLQFLTWANTYDLRGGAPRWWHGILASRRTAAGAAGPVGDIVLPDGRPAWVDGGPRGPLERRLTGADDLPLVHRESIGLGRLTELGDAAPVAALAPDQYAAVTHRAGAARIIAPAGSGKTRVLTARLRHLLRDRGVEPQLVTAVAYNTRAAAEMRERTRDLDASIRTLHSLALWIGNLDERREVIDEREVRSLLDRMVTTAKIPNQDPFQPYLEALSEVRLALRDPAEVEAARGDVDGFAELFDRYREELARRRVVDFDEQIYRAIELLLTRPDLRGTAQRAGTHLLVDEFQDLTPAFLLLVRLVAGPSMQVFAVGDDDQTIYSYAGATPRYLVDFDRWFPGAADHPLEVNYRCPPAVVDSAVSLLSHNRTRVPKTIRAGQADDRAGPTDDRAGQADDRVEPDDDRGGQLADRGGQPDDRGGQPADRSTLTVAAGEMAGTAVTAIAAAIDAGAAPAQLAVLARVNSALLPVQVALTDAGVAHTGPLDTAVLGRTGVRTALAYLRMGLDLERIRREDLFDTINRPARKVKSAVSPLLKRGSRFTIRQLEQVADALDRTHQERFTGYLGDLHHLEAAITEGADTGACLRIIRDRIGLGEAMDALDRSRTRPEGSSHGDDLDALEQLASLQPDPAVFRDWLVAHLRVPGDPTGVTLSSVHRVKGMEWDEVVVFAASNGLFPHRLADDVEEERRVFHVAITRCRKRVHVVADRDRPSPFVAELSQAADRPARPDPGPDRAVTPADAPGAGVQPTRRDDGAVVAAVGLEVTVPGGFRGRVVAIDGPGVVVDARQVADARGDASLADVGGPRDEASGSGADRYQVRLRVAFGTPVTVDGERTRLAGPTPTRRTGLGDGRLDLGGGEPEVDDALYESLRSWRARIAAETGLPAYLVFHDRHLQVIAGRKPRTLRELAGCPGVGPTKLERYGDDVLDLVDAHA